MNKGIAELILFDCEADEYAAIIRDYPISHNDCIEILTVAAKLKTLGFSNDLIKDRLLRLVLKED